MSSRSGRCGHGRSGGGQLGGLARHAPAGRAPAAHHTPPLSTRRSSRACACPGLASGKNQKCTLALLAVSSAQLRSCTLALCACCASVVSAISIAFSANRDFLLGAWPSTDTASASSRPGMTIVLLALAQAFVDPLDPNPMQNFSRCMNLGAFSTPFAGSSLAKRRYC